MGWLHKKEVKDGTESLEEKLSRIVAKLEMEGAREKEKTLLRDEWHRKMEAERQMEKDRQQQIEEEISAFKDLYAQAQRLEKARYMRNYINAAEKDAKNKCNLTEEKKNWISWARIRVDWYDPLCNVEDKELIDIGNVINY